MGESRSFTKTVTNTTTVHGEHTHTISGYSLIRGIGDGEPVASDRFIVGGHEWVLLFYPDGKRSSSETQAHHHHAANLPPPGVAPVGAAGGGDIMMIPHGQPVGDQQAGNVGQGGLAGLGHVVVPAMNPVNLQRRVRDARSRGPGEENEYAALFVALIGEGPSPQGVVSTSDGKVVRAFHRFTLVDQTESKRDWFKGRARDAGAVKISCARQDPTARNCHGYRKFVKRSILEDPSKGYLVNDTIVIKYSIDLVVTQGGALSRCLGSGQIRTDLIRVPTPMLGNDLSALLRTGAGADVQFVADGEEFNVHKIILEARSPVFCALLNSPMREGSERVVHIKNIRAPIFRALLHFVYTDTVQELNQEDGCMDAAFAQHLLEAADRYELVRLRRICERRLCQTVDVETAATTLTLAEQNHAADLKVVCLDFVARNLQSVLVTDGYQHMLASCPNLQADIISTVASMGAVQERTGHRHTLRLHHREHGDEDEGRRVRQRRGD
ncbi:hypothetical protein BSKO_08565 [Bryopsis sp. KO-2023]|nr:hypothetical protein BSKO_08565 [Bryopsis sp. KO-2023]